MIIRVGDRIQWDAEAHVHTSQMDIPDTGRVEAILPKAFKHFGETVDSCEREDAGIIWVQVDDSTARIGFGAGAADLAFPAAEDVWEESDEESGLDLLRELWSD